LNAFYSVKRGMGLKNLIRIVNKASEMFNRNGGYVQKTKWILAHLVSNFWQ
jgi:hypothetical protein